jgi:hypothetical protein
VWRILPEPLEYPPASAQTLTAPPRDNPGVAGELSDTMDTDTGGNGIPPRLAHRHTRWCIVPTRAHGRPHRDGLSL